MEPEKILLQKLLQIKEHVSELMNCSTIDKKEFDDLIRLTKNEMKSLINLSDNYFINGQITKLSTYATFDELNFFKQASLKLVYSKVHIDWIEQWEKRGKFLSDLESIQQIIDGILFNIKTDANNGEHP